ncbi:lipopolysaccharide biosynthesis protein [Luteitalea sp.]|uniref:lipopolysaccharide biosynthesis protein n=1 Tax=Luteitalea sp. TaxID=2004800 RepID=UPI0025B99FC6|nr:oligosaccharide flippase family protein [Luteitalea sp.]
MNRFLKNVLSNWAGMAVGMATAFFMSPFLVHRLGDHQYGLWVLIISVTGYMGLLDVGLKVSVVKYVSQLSATRDFEGLNRVASTALAIYGGVGLLIVLITVVIERFFSRLFAIQGSDADTARVVLLLAGINVAATLVVSIPGGVLAGLQRYDLSSAAGIKTLVFRTLAIVALVSAGFGIAALALVHLCSQVLNGVLTWRSARLECPTLRLERRLMSLETAKQLWSYSAFVLVNNVGRVLLFGSSEVVVGSLLGTVAVTYYAISGTVAQYMQQIVVTMAQVLHPHAAAQHAKGSTEGLRSAALMGTRLSLLVGLPITVTVVVLGERFISLWMGPEYGRIAGPLLTLLTLARLVHLSQAGSYEVLLGMSRHRVPTTLNLVAGVLSVAGSLLFGRWYGLTGVAVGGAIPILVLHGAVQPWYTNRSLDISWRTYLWRSVLPPLAAAIPYALVLFAVVRMKPPESLVTLALTVAGTLPVFGIAGLFLCFDAEHRSNLSLGLLKRPAARASGVAGGSDNG